MTTHERCNCRSCREDERRMCEIAANAEAYAYLAAVEEEED